MKFTQSRMQSIIYRVKYALLLAALAIFYALISSYFGGEFTKEVIKFNVLIILAIPILIIVWLVVFNTGKSKIDECTIEFTDEGIRYVHMATLESISWSKFKSYKIKGGFRKMLTIYAEDNEIAFDLGLFDAEQQKSIITELSKKH